MLPPVALLLGGATEWLLLCGKEYDHVAIDLQLSKNVDAQETESSVVNSAVVSSGYETEKLVSFCDGLEILVVPPNALPI